MLEIEAESNWQLTAFCDSMKSCAVTVFTLLRWVVHGLSFPPPPKLNSIPLPAKLAGGLLLFQRSIKAEDRELSKEILELSQDILRRDPLISMELGSDLEAGGVFSSSSSNDGEVHQLVMEFQINGGNSWAQAKVHGIKIQNSNAVFLQSLEVSNMDAALMGGSVQVQLPPFQPQVDSGGD